MSIVIIDYKSGNINSVLKSFEFISNKFNNQKVIVSDKLDEISKATRLVLPGVGSFENCKDSLFKKKGLFEIIEKKVLQDKVPFLGICVGHQLLGDEGFENNVITKGFGWIKGKVKLIKPNNNKFKIPHMGWNEVKIKSTDHPLWKNIGDKSHFYFTHSYNFEVQNKKNLFAITSYESQITAAIINENVVGTQFHPEKSQENGLKFIQNFIFWNP